MTINTPADPLVEALKPFADKWKSLRDPLPQHPFSVTVDAMACCQAAQALDHSSRVTPPADAWRVRDFADGWILFPTKPQARREARGTDRAVQPLYATPPAPDLEGVRAALSVIAAASRRSETMFGGKMSEITRVFENITRVSEQALATLQPKQEQR